MEVYYRAKVAEQQTQQVSSERGNDGPLGKHAQSQLDNFKLLHRMTTKKLHALQSESEGTQREVSKLGHKLRKSIREERKATQLASKVMGPLEKLHSELSSRVKGAEQAKLADLLNSTRIILEKHKYAFEWKNEVHRRSLLCRTASSRYRLSIPLHSLISSPLTSQSPCPNLPSPLQGAPS